MENSIKPQAEPDKESTPQAPDWLLETQNKSWEPEILISGISLTSLFILPDYIFNFCAYLIQEVGFATTEGTILQMYLMFVVQGLKLGFLSHLLLRGLWTGLIGLSYVFPEGANREKIPKRLTHINFAPPIQSIIKLEKTCSLVFSATFSLVIPLAILCAFLLLIFYAMTFLNLGEMASIFIIFLLVTLYLIFYKYSTHSKIGIAINSSIISNISYTFSTHFGKWRSSIIVLLVMASIVPLSKEHLFNFDFNNFKSGLGKTAVHVHKSAEYYLATKSEYRLERGAIPQYEVYGEYLRLFLPHYKMDENTLEVIASEGLTDSLKAHYPGEIEEVVDLYRFEIWNKPLSVSSVYLQPVGLEQQQGWQVEFDLEDLPTGPHVLTLRKLIYVNVWPIRKGFKYRLVAS